ncbi:MAG: MotA/TolQ/ExbB proton channel family protein [Sutterellaceae bacterium]|nr:MotA/TolQ/ExbB proton channel family protein [Burkholderiaceae bacterium]MCX7902352.1 MotA/TolQ/ExbB proton channel family protein [Burkholderiaceae bacterium]MDW8430172.1 MotA/TolQ/ExbB proton channel family protein [Sutterellaceae bacterium]
MGPETVTVGLAHFWAHADAVIRATAYLLLAMSVGSWFLILWKAWAWLRVRRAARQLENFWNAPSVEAAIAQLRAADAEQLFVPLAQSAAGAAAPPASADSLAARIDRSELITRALRQRINEAAARLESGLTFLASVGSTAPFVGLFGTVWGIYQAMLAIAAAGTVSLDRVAGPVGEALLMTAFGLAVAIPAVLAYNAFTRVNRVLLAQLDGFAHDLHAYLTTGERLGGAAAA